MKFLKKYWVELKLISRQISFRGLKGASLYDVVMGLELEALSMRASAMAFNFFMALFPTLIFMFTAVAYIPIEGLQDGLITSIESFVPKNIFETLESTIEDVVLEKRGGLLSIGFLFAVIFSSNGIDAALQAFNKKRLDTYKKRSFIKRKIVAFSLLFLIFLLMILSLVVLTKGGAIIQYFKQQGWLFKSLWIGLFWIFEWVVVLFISINTMSMLYYFGTSTTKKKSFLTIGSVLAGVVCIITSLLFTFYVNQFGKYNSVYGSIGTIIALLLWLYINSMVILMGFEITTSIMINSHKQDKENI